MSNALTIRELDAATTAWIDQEAQRSGVPVETVVRHLIYRGIEAERKHGQQQVHHDLDAFAGTWSAEEAAEFVRAVEDFNRIDTELWQ